MLVADADSKVGLAKVRAWVLVEQEVLAFWYILTERCVHGEASCGGMDVSGSNNWPLQPSGRRAEGRAPGIRVWYTGGRQRRTLKWGIATPRRASGALRGVLSIRVAAKCQRERV